MRVVSLIALAMAVAGSAAALSSCCTTSKTVMDSQPVPVIGQETGLWCWAASGEMCMDFLGENVSQCDQANRRLGRSDCCNNPTPGSCVSTGWPEFAKYNFGFTTTTWGSALSWGKLKDEIHCEDRPFAFSWGWSGGGGHMMVLVGYFSLAGVNYVTINDPLPVGSGSQYVRTYDQYVSSTSYTHWRDYYELVNNN